MVSPNLVMLHMDKDIWGDPENFRPERFINDGQICPALDKSLPFGAGIKIIYYNNIAIIYHFVKFGVFERYRLYTLKFICCFREAIVCWRDVRSAGLVPGVRSIYAGVQRIDC